MGFLGFSILLATVPMSVCLPVECSVPFPVHYFRSALTAELNCFQPCVIAPNKDQEFLVDVLSLDFMSSDVSSPELSWRRLLVSKFQRGRI